LFGARISGFPTEAKAVSKNGIRFAKEKGRMIAARLTRCATLAVVVVLQVFIGGRTAFGADQVHDEIQVYNAEIAAVGQWTYQQHLNYAVVGQSQPEVPGGFSSNHQRRK
jgi:hypothetical protein